MKEKIRIMFIPLIVLGFILIFTNSCKKEEDTSGTITDMDGNVYTSITIGTQIWMAENLKTTKYNDGSSIQFITDNTAWSNITTLGYCWYNNEATYKNTYGALYNWYTVNTGKLCPIGWHVPTKSEWTTLADYLGGESEAGSKMKETGNIHWISPLTIATNTSGFTALPGGYRSSDGSFNFIGYNGDWWSSTEYNTSEAWVLDMYYEVSYVSIASINKSYGLSVRCIKD